jgi:hypothetical protein
MLIKITRIAQKINEKGQFFIKNYPDFENLQLILSVQLPIFEIHSILQLADIYIYKV